MSKSTERHKRESRSKIAELMNVSAETVRKAGTVSSFFADGSEAMASGQWAMIAIDLLPYEREMAKARMSAGGGDKKSGMSKQTDPINGKGTSRDKAAAAVGVTVQELINETLTKIFW